MLKVVQNSGIDVHMQLRHHQHLLSIVFRYLSEAYLLRPPMKDLSEE
uniref:Uncharacterized protein n=1 Tax=Meloidogyne enterolobii TaxID=390850 RepID=A0A6V7XW76_MELEN|nr:unnamed protein product [Meloidogyne enterolobii]